MNFGRWGSSKRQRTASRICSSSAARSSASVEDGRAESAGGVAALGRLLHDEDDLVHSVPVQQVTRSLDPALPAPRLALGWPAIRMFVWCQIGATPCGNRRKGPERDGIKSLEIRASRGLS